MARNSGLNIGLERLAKGRCKNLPSSAATDVEAQKMTASALCHLPLLQLIHSLPLDLVAWYRNRNRSPAEERTVALVVITLVVILAVPITAPPIAIATAAVIAIAITAVIAAGSAVVIAAATAAVISTGAMISSVTTVISFTRLGRSNSDYC
jgi:hypothetical protein